MNIYLTLVTNVYQKFKIKNAQKHATRLLKSGYPHQWTDYIMIRKWEKQNKKNIRVWMPVDTKIYPLVQFLMNYTRLSGWDEGNKKETGFIFCQVGGTRQTKTFEKLVQTLKHLFKNVPEITMDIEMFKPDGVTINFNHDQISEILRRLKLRPSKKQSLPGANTIRKYKKWTYRYMNNLLKDVTFYKQLDDQLDDE